MFEKRIKGIACVVYCVFLLLHQCASSSVALHFKLDCKTDQVKRWTIKGSYVCCYTVKCIPGQKFAFCGGHNGHDTCQNCPEGYSHKDFINTAHFKYKIDPCVKEEECSDYSDLIEQNGECVCDRTRGYYGRDKNRCAADNRNCKKAGHELNQDGGCEICGQEHFKAAEDYSLCIKKTSCTNDQEVDFKGSHTADRTCRRRIVPKRDIPAPVKPTIKATNKTKYDKKSGMGDGDMSQSMEEKNGTVDITDLNRPTKENNSEQNSGSQTIVIVALTVISIFLPVCFVMILIIFFKKGQHRNLFCCLQNVVNHHNHHMNFDAENVIVGDNNKMLYKEEASEVSEDTDLKKDVDNDYD